MDKKPIISKGTLGFLLVLLGVLLIVPFFYIQLYYRGWNNDLFLRLFWILLEPDRRLRRAGFVVP